MRCEVQAALGLIWHQEHRKLVEATASYMRFEQLCHRTELFSESYLTHPIGQFLLARHGKKTRAEWTHPLLASTKTGPGRRPSVDFAVLQDDGQTPAIAVEAKWLGSANDLLEQAIRDLVRLELLVHEYHATGYVLLAGTRRRAESLFEKKAARPHPTQPSSRALFPRETGAEAWLRLQKPSEFRRSVVERALRPFAGIDIEIAAGIRISSSGLFPKDAPLSQCCVLGWKIERAADERFRPATADRVV